MSNTRKYFGGNQILAHFTQTQFCIRIIGGKSGKIEHNITTLNSNFSAKSRLSSAAINIVIERHFIEQCLDILTNNFISQYCSQEALVIGGRRNDPLGKAPASSLRSYCIGFSTKYPKLLRGDSRLLYMYSGSTIEGTVYTHLTIKTENSRQLLHPIRNGPFFHSCPSSYRTCMGHRLILFSELHAALYLVRL